MSKCGKCCYGVMTMPNKMFCSVQNCFCEEVFDCEDFEPIIKQQTNADRIRAMTDEELAEYLAETCADVWNMFVDPKQMWLEWLKQEET